ncbi:HDL154Cp [Eremothecium sinecaudum]|uniref:Multifunctional methyltransferase subunit trm112 n=1 Tax=Eremothecium sinecaudum TaxID=45286 RepID=A0A0X8HSD0_9SACH|nr:HDL154Cp [Eremothecium sinecaudum]AMD20590.1 HDL154Cp [Eremothecium sinecaudum]
MKFLTTNFLKCAVPACDSSNDNFPLHYIGEKCQLQQDESLEFNAQFLLRILDRVDWNAVVAVAHDLGNSSLPAAKPELPREPEQLSEEQMVILRDLHTLFVQTSIAEGEMQCRNCGQIYYIKNSIPNLLLPPHLA